MSWRIEPDDMEGDATQLEEESPFARIYSPDGSVKNVEFTTAKKEGYQPEGKVSEASEVEEKKPRFWQRFTLPKMKLPDLSFLGGSVSISLGVAALSIHWLSVLPPPFNLDFFLMISMMALPAMAFGWFTSRDFMRHRKEGERRDRAGAIGFTLGFVSLLLSTAWLLLFSAFIWGFR